MANGVFNVSKGRAAEFHERVNNNDPTNAVLVVVLLASTGLEADGALQDYANLSALLAASSNEATNTNYARKTLTDADIAAITIDSTNNRVDADIPDQTWVSVANTGTGAIGKLLICYDSDSTSGTDTSIIPVTYHDFVVTPDGSNIVAQIDANGYFRAS